MKKYYHVKREITPMWTWFLPFPIYEVIASSRLDWFRAKSLEDLGIGNLSMYLDNSNYLFESRDGNFIEFK